MNTDKITIEQDGKDILFNSELIAEAESNDRSGDENCSESAGRWEDLRLWATNDNRFICVRKVQTIWEGEKDTKEVKICLSREEVIEFFGQYWLARKLYADAGWR